MISLSLEQSLARYLSLFISIYLSSELSLAPSLSVSLANGLSRTISLEQAHTHTQAHTLSVRYSSSRPAVPLSLSLPTSPPTPNPTQPNLTQPNPTDSGNYWKGWASGYKYPHTVTQSGMAATAYDTLITAAPEVLGGLRYFTSDGNKTGAFVAMRWLRDGNLQDPTMRLDHVVYTSSPVKRVDMDPLSTTTAATEAAASLYNVDAARVIVTLQESVQQTVPHLIYSMYDWTRDSGYTPDKIEATYSSYVASTSTAAPTSAPVTAGPTSAPVVQVAVNEIQTITTSQNPVHGSFTLGFQGSNSNAIQITASASDVMNAIGGMTGIGAVSVNRTQNTDGYSWAVTFTDQGANPGDVPLMNATANFADNQMMPGGPGAVHVVETRKGVAASTK